MLNQLTINNYAIVEHLDIELNQGMTVITGETGAGKSIMLDALSLALGDRADKDVIRMDAERTDITACFHIKQNKEALAWLKDQDFSDVTGNECILRRIITREGRSKAYINGQPTTLNELKELGEMLIDIHSQHEHQSLLKRKTHQRLLDEYSGQQSNAAKVKQTATNWHRLSRELAEIQARAEDNNAQFQLISYQVQELDELDLGENELEELDQEHKKLSHAESSLQLSQQVLDICSDNDQQNIRQSINQALSMLQSIPYPSKHVNEAGNLLTTALIQIEEASTELSHSIDQYEPNPARLEELNQRLTDIHQLARKHRVNSGEILELHQKLKLELENMAHADVKIESIQQELDEMLIDYHKSAAALSTTRQKQARKLEKRINDQIAKLGMVGASFSLVLNTEVSDSPQTNGYENIEFLVSTNPGQPPKPLIKIASGGELSRISLAIQVVTAQTSKTPSMVFDEVDAGIGGGVARSVGAVLRKLGEKGQVLCVTHQPQVASQGHHHLYISKSSSGKASTSTEITVLGKQQRIEEIARMLAGEELSEHSLAHAQELMA